MNINISQIRAKARYLLDDNIFGKDWLKSVFVHILMTVIILSTGGVLYTLSNEKLLPFLMDLVGDISVVLKYGIPAVLDFVEILLLYIIIGPVSVGLAYVYLDLIRGEGTVKIKKFFYGFKNFIGNFILGFMYMLQVGLWTVFFIVPGIYVAYSYALIFYVKSDHPEYRWKECFDESERLMEGRRWQLFKLQISHIGWVIVGLAFVLIGSFWAAPYLETSTAIFYEEAKAARYARS